MWLTLCLLEQVSTINGLTRFRIVEYASMAGKAARTTARALPQIRALTGEKRRAHVGLLKLGTTHLKATVAVNSS